MITVQFTADLSALQGVLISSDYVHSFANLKSKGGNEKKIDFIIDNLRNFLKKENYINDEGVIQDAVDTMRRFALYIVLNSDLPVLDKLVNTDSAIDLFIWTVPTITKCLMCEILWKLSMEKYIYEIISFSYPQLCLEVADALIMNLKYFNPTECLQQLHVLSTACFRFLCRINFFEFDENQLKLGFSNFQRCMTYFCNPPNESKLERLNKDDLYKYYGNCLQTMLGILYKCFCDYNTTQTHSLDQSVALYEITYKDDCKKIDYKPCMFHNKSVLEILNKCRTDLLDKCMKLVMGINIDIFCAWSEFEVGGATMQESIGELCYKVRQELLTSDSSDHPVVSMLEQISRKPVQQIIDMTDSSAIIENINKSNNDSIQWLQALIHSDKLLDDTALLQILDSKLNQLSEDHCCELFNKFYNHIQTYAEHNEYIQSLAIKAYHQCNKDMKQNFVDNHFKNDTFNDILESTQFDQMVTGIFNKLSVSPDLDLSDILSVFIQNPRKVFFKIFKSAVENEQQMNLMFKAITLLAKFSNHYYIEDTEPCLTIVLKNTIDEEHDTDVKQDNLISFVYKLKNADIISGTKLLLLIIMPKLHAALVKTHYRDIKLLCHLLSKCYSVEDLSEYRAPMLAMLGQVMRQVRWKINTFDTLAPTILNLAIDLQTKVMNSYNGLIPDNEVSWLKSKLKELDPLNMYYYRQLWNPPGNNFAEVISGIQIDTNMDVEMLTLWLAQGLCSTTLQEWDCLWDSLNVFGETKVLDLFHDALLSVLAAEKSNRTNTTWSCLLYCYKNFLHCIRYKFFKEPLRSSQVLTVTNKLVTIINLIHEGNIEDFEPVIIPIFSYIAQRREDYAIDISQKLKNNLPPSKLSTMINNIFCNGSRCDEPEKDPHLMKDNFPSYDQLWGMIATIFATVVCWVLYSKIISIRKPFQDQHHTMSQITKQARRGHK